MGVEDMEGCSRHGNSWRVNPETRALSITQCPPLSGIATSRRALKDVFVVPPTLTPPQQVCPA